MKLYIICLGLEAIIIAQIGGFITRDLQRCEQVREIIKIDNHPPLIIR